MWMKIGRIIRLNDCSRWLPFRAINTHESRRDRMYCGLPTRAVYTVVSRYASQTERFCTLEFTVVIRGTATITETDLTGVSVFRTAFGDFKPLAHRASVSGFGATLPRHFPSGRLGTPTFLYWILFQYIFNVYLFEVYGTTISSALKCTSITKYHQ